MEFVEIVVFVVSGVVTAVSGWAVWATVMLFNLDKRVEMNTQDDENVKKSTESVNVNVKELTDNINAKLDMIVSELNAIKIALAKNDIEVK